MPQEAPFDPCKQWLGIDAVQLGDARLVLGVAARESDPGIVNRAADARLKLLRAIAPGPFELARASLVKRVEEAQARVLAEIAAGAARAAVPTVDGFAMPPPPGQLASTMATAAPPPMPVPAPPPTFAAGPAMPPPVPGQAGWGGQSETAGDGFGSIRIRTTVYRKKTPGAGVALALLALAAVAGALAYYTLVVKGQREIASRGPDKNKSVQPVQKEDEKKNVETTRDQEDREGQRSDRQEREREDRRKQALEELERQRRERDMPGGQKQDAVKNELIKPTREPDRGPQDDPKKDEPKKEEVVKDGPGRERAEQFEAAVAAVFAAMRAPEGEPGSGSITELLAQASSQAVGGDAKNRVARWRALATYRQGFLDCRTKALAAVKNGDEYDVKDRKIAVVEVDEKVFTYHENGRNKTLPRADLPAGLVLAIVTSWFDARPANELYLGAYHFTKQEPNARLAREHWEKAEAGGADASSLLPLLDDPVFTRATAGE
jgi:hypothetical protein